MNLRIPKTIHELNSDMTEMFALVRDDPRRSLQAKELANLGGKILNAQKLLIVYSALRGEEPDLPFMGKTSGRQLKTNARLISA
jgi:hypothetical protein